MGYFRKSCPTNHDKILNFVRLKMEVPIYNGTFCSFMLKVCCFVVIGPLRVNTLTKNANCQSSLGYRNETVLRRKMGYFRKSCPTNHDKY